MLKVRAVAVAVVALTSAVAIWASCAVYDRSLLVLPDAAFADAGPVEADIDAGVCVGATVPPRPGADDPAVLDGGELTMTVSHFDFDPSVGTGLRGFDLDRACTCPGAPSCKSPKPQCDDEAGRDNVGGVQVKLFSAVADAFKPDQLNGRLAKGLYGLLFRVRGWNGSANDSSVETALYISKGTERLNDAGARVLPKFDGTDVFTVAESSLLGGIAPPYIPLPDAVDTAAYVKDGVLVARGANVKFEFSTSAVGDNSLVLNLTGVILTATITKANGGYGLDNGTLAGRWAVRRFLVALAPLYDPIGGGYLCGDASTYQSIKGLACGSVDISESPQNDNANANCDALSMALGFTAVPVTFGTVQAGTQLAQPCGPQWVDDCRP